MDNLFLPRRAGACGGVQEAQVRAVFINIEWPSLYYWNSVSKFHDVYNNIRTALLNLPKPIRRVCYVQIFAFMGWCVFLPSYLIFD